MPSKKKTSKEPAGFRYLGKNVAGVAETVDKIAWKGGPITVTLDCTEFTSTCPITGQPDFGRFVIEYVPDRWLIETKSLKFFLRKYRDFKSFNEELVDIIALELWAQIEPVSIKVTGTFNLRGGIGVTAIAQRER